MQAKSFLMSPGNTHFRHEGGGGGTTSSAKHLATPPHPLIRMAQTERGRGPIPAEGSVAVAEAGAAAAGATAGAVGAVEAKVSAVRSPVHCSVKSPTALGKKCTHTHTDFCGEGGHKARYPNGGLPGEMGLRWLGVGVATTAGSVACVGPARISRRAARHESALHTHTHTHTL